jgi:hypothetical protein
MTPTRREFIRSVGIAFASFMATRCSLPFDRESDSPRDRLRECWSCFDWLAEEARHWEDYERGEKARRGLVSDHQAALNELVSAGDLDAAVADQVQIAFSAAAYHVWRSNCGNTCYLHTFTLDYKPAGAGQLVQQAELLADIAETGEVDPAAVAVAQAAVERDIAFLALSGEEAEAFYDILTQTEGDSKVYPSFGELDLEITPEAAAAARFLVELLLGEPE